MAEEVDADAVRRVLESALPSPVDVERLTRLSGGASADSYALDAVDGHGARHELILRRETGRPAFGMAIEKRAEALTQLAAGAAGAPVAPVIAILEPAQGLGDGYLMRRLAGETIPRKLLRDDAFAAARARLGDDCAAALARIHHVPRQALPALPELSAAQQLEVLEALHRSFGQPVPTFELALRWLRERLPRQPEESALVHGDFRNGNLLVDADGLVAVLDWELAHLGDPMEDLGWLCTPAWRFGGPGEAGGFATGEQLRTAYQQASGRAVDPAALRFWQAFGSLKWGVICQAQAFTHLRGSRPSVELATIGRRVTETELDLLLLIDDGEEA